MPRFPQLASDQSADQLEQGLLAQWREEGLFARTLAARRDAPPFVFYEGPPTANGRPGIHHVFARTIKDLFCRHRAMQGHLVLRKAGWDTHGLPVEIEVEKELQREAAAQHGDNPDSVAKLGGKQLIEQIGVAEFNRRCRESVWKYRGDWQQMSERIAYWLDYDDPYVTYTNNYVESVWWSLRTLHDKGLLVRGHKILPYCARCGTALSSHEVAQGYEDVEDPSVHVAFALADDAVPIGTGLTDVERTSAAASGLLDGALTRQILVWTTTPWTLVSNVGVAVHDDFEYVEVRQRNGDARTLLLASGRLAGVLGVDWSDRWAIVMRVMGAALAGRHYTRPLEWLPVAYGSGKIVPERFVSGDEGTGVVHMAPAFGADDYAAGQRHGLELLQPVAADGHFKADVPVIGGMWFKDANPVIEADLKARGLLWRSKPTVHSYPHCWRCGTPLLYYARGSWFIKTTAVRDDLLARNAQVDWHPEEVGSGRFGEWLFNNVDWAISRDRYWGTPLPVWINDEDASDVAVIGSFAELADKLGRALPDDFDPHKPHIDQYTWPAPSGAGTMRRVNEVIDTWYDSGSMPFAQWHFPFENHDMVAKQYPADFIAEGVDQTRGWFYSLLAIATGLGDALPNNSKASAAPYRSVVVNDLVLDAQGQKMSKSKGNIVNPWDVIARHGVDAVRLFLVASSQVWVPRKFDEQAIREIAGRFLVTFKNVYSGSFAQYANFGWAPGPLDPPVADRPAIDRWILSRLTRVEREVDAQLTRYDPTVAARTVMQFVDDDVSNWYVRLSRGRFYDVDGADNRAAFATLHEVLAVTCRLLAPFAPFVTDAMHRHLTGESVHLANFVRPTQSHEEPDLESAMADIRALTALAHKARDVAEVKVRQPLSRLQCIVPGDSARLKALVPLLASELNVKGVEFVASNDDLVTLEAKPNFRTLGKKFGKTTPVVAEATMGLTAGDLRTLERGSSVVLMVNGNPATIDAGDIFIVRRPSGNDIIVEDAGYGVALDPTVTPELRQEGLAREIIRKVQQFRKSAQLDVSDRIALAVEADEELSVAVALHRDRIADEVLAVCVLLGDDAGSPFREGETDGTIDRWTATQATDVEGRPVRLALRKEGN